MFKKMLIGLSLIVILPVAFAGGGGCGKVCPELSLNVVLAKLKFECIESRVAKVTKNIYASEKVCNDQYSNSVKILTLGDYGHDYEGATLSIDLEGELAYKIAKQIEWKTQPCQEITPSKYKCEFWKFEN